jgi:hypothetical protein
LVVSATTFRLSSSKSTSACTFAQASNNIALRRMSRGAIVVANLLRLPRTCRACLVSLSFATTPHFSSSSGCPTTTLSISVWYTAYRSQVTHRITRLRRKAGAQYYGQRPRSFAYALSLIAGSREVAETVLQWLLQAERDNILRAPQSQIRGFCEPSTLVIQCELEQGPLTAGY